MVYLRSIIQLFGCKLLPARWLVPCLFALTLQLSCGQWAQAGCEHASAADASQLTTDGLDKALLGKWQYLAGRVYYLFHPQQPPCEGPNCRPVPDQPNSLSTIPASDQLRLPIAYHPMALVDSPRQHWPMVDCSSMMRSRLHGGTLLRPPIQL